MKYFDEFGNEVTSYVQGLTNEFEALKKEVCCLKEQLEKRHTPKKPKPKE